MTSISLLIVTLFVTFFVIQISSSPASPQLKVFYRRAPQGWHAYQRPASTDSLKLVFAVKQSNLDVLKTTLYEVSDPNHPNFGKHLTLDQVDELTANPEATRVVEEFLLSNGVSSDKITKTRSGDFITVQLSVETAENLLRTEFMTFQHSTSRKTAIKTNVYSLPAVVAEHLDFVSANCLFPLVRPASVTAHKTVPFVPGQNKYPGYVSPDVLFSYYGIDNPVVASASATQSVYESLGQSYDATDLASFQKQFNVPVNPVAKVIGPNTPNSCSSDPNNCIEALLDVEYIMAVAQKSPTTYWSIDSNDQSPFLDWIIAVGNDATAPLVHSISYGDIEPQDDPSVDQRFDTEIQQLGTRGITVIVASGDDGVANFLARNDSSQCGFTPSFPATSPHVTSVGATQGPENSKTEIACTASTGGDITTGGGFSFNFNQPSYQAAAVQQYTQSATLPPSSMYNTGGRGYPDVAMLGHNYLTLIGGQLYPGSGTSASAPVFAAVITLANGIRIKEGKKPLGFLNQILYDLGQTNPSVYIDITSGENNCCAGNAVCCQYGFYAAKGWDPLTGFGSVNYKNFVAALSAL